MFIMRKHSLPHVEKKTEDRNGTLEKDKSGCPGSTSDE